MPNCIFRKKNVEKTQRNGKAPESKTIIKYITQTGLNGVDGFDAFQVLLTPNNKTFSAGAYNAENQTHYVGVHVYRGTTPISALVLDSSITGTIPDALEVSVVEGTNGTQNTQLLLTVTENLTAAGGELVIPVQYHTNTYDPVPDVSSEDSSIDMTTFWDPELNALDTFNAIFSWSLGKTGESMYILDLSNETASINCSSTGHVISSAVRPPCKATLSFGSNNNLSGVYYDASWGISGVTGIGINHQTGEVLYDSAAHSHDSKFPSGNFDFGDASTNTVLNLTIDASYDGRIRGRKVMKIEKALPGQQGPSGYTPYVGSNGNWWINGEDTGVPATGEPGDDAVTRWIDLSADQVKIDASGNILPPTITAAIWKQVGGNTPQQETDTSWNIKWSHDTGSFSAYSSAITVLSSWDYMTFKLYLGSVYAGETETVPILKDGAPGAQGRRGAAIRGPVLWDSSSNVNVTGLAKRWFYCGVQTHDTRPEEAEFIDVILHNNTYYMCIDNYEQAAGATWSSVSSKWQAADASFNFVAANLILAKNAGIDFLTGNEIYLRDPSGNVTAGAAGGNGVSFWAGANSPTLAPFKVRYDGTMTASKGIFGCLEIGQDSNFGSILEGSFYDTSDYTTKEIEINPSFIRLSDENESITIAPDANRDKLDGNALIDINCDSSIDLALSTNACVNAGMLTVNNTRSPHPAGLLAGSAVITPGLFGLEVVFQTNTDSSTSYFTKNSSTGTWYFKGIDTQVLYGSYPYVAVQTSVTGEQSAVKLGYWAYYATSYGTKIFSGIAGPNIQKQPGVIYIKI